MNLFKRFKQYFLADSSPQSGGPSSEQGTVETFHPAIQQNVQAKRQVFNANAMQEMLSVCSSPAFFERLLIVYLRDSKAHLEQLNHASDQHDYELWRRTLHDMKGAANNMRVERLADAVQKAHAIKIQDFERTSPALLQAIQAEYDQAEQALKSATAQTIGAN